MSDDSSKNGSSVNGKAAPSVPQKVPPMPKEAPARPPRSSKAGEFKPLPVGFPTQEELRREREWQNLALPSARANAREADAREAALARRRAKTKTNTVNISRQRTREFHLHVGGGGRSAAPSSSEKSLPGSGFTSDEDIRAFSEAIRKQARPRAVERALDAETLESVLKAVPDVTGSLAGSRGRARRVARHLKRIAAAEKLIAKQAAALYATFCREYEAELSQVSRGRARQTPRAAIWKA